MTGFKDWLADIGSNVSRRTRNEGAATPAKWSSTYSAGTTRSLHSTSPAYDSSLTEAQDLVVKHVINWRPESQPYTRPQTWLLGAIPVPKLPTGKPPSASSLEEYELLKKLYRLKHGMTNVELTTVMLGHLRGTSGATKLSTITVA